MCICLCLCIALQRLACAYIPLLALRLRASQLHAGPSERAKLGDIGIVSPEEAFSPEHAVAGTLPLVRGLRACNSPTSSVMYRVLGRQPCT